MAKYVFALLVFCAHIAYATLVQSIHVEWGYTPPSSPEVSGFVLYEEGVQVCYFPGKDITFGDCSVPLTKPETLFTLTAKFADGTESPHSAPFNFCPVKAKPPEIISITIL